jgi:hypothetical protein
MQGGMTGGRQREILRGDVAGERRDDQVPLFVGAESALTGWATVGLAAATVALTIVTVVLALQGKAAGKTASAQSAAAKGWRS